MTRKLITAIFAGLVAVSSTNVARAEIKLAADLIAGAASSSVTPVGRLAGGLLVVAANQAGQSELLIAREPSGAFASVKVLSSTTTGSSSTSEGVFFSIPQNLPLAGTNWFTDGTPDGTFLVPFAKSDVFQRNGAEVIFKGVGSPDLHRLNLATGQLTLKFVDTNYRVDAIINGTPISLRNDGNFYAYDPGNKRWNFMGTYQQSIDTPIYIGKNRDRIFIAWTSESSATIYRLYAQDNWATLARVGDISSNISSSAHQARFEARADGGTLYLACVLETWEFLTLEPYQSDPYYHDAWIDGSTLPATFKGGHEFIADRGDRYSGVGFVADAGRLYSISYPSSGQPRTAHETLNLQGESIAVTALRIVGDTLLIFGSTPSLGSEVFSASVDVCPSDLSKLFPGACGCGVADVDSDRDGTLDCLDLCVSDPDKIAPGVCGCGTIDKDSDGDGTMDCVDSCQLDPQKTAVGACGCGVVDTDTDGDGTPDCKDSCTLDSKKTAPGVCGCGVVDVDSDLDGVADCKEGCPNSALKTEPGICGCSVADTDSDGDGTPNCIDACAQDALKIGLGVCGCGVADTDTDGDLYADCVDACPLDPNKVQPGKTGCGVSEKDSDGDGTPDAIDACAADPRKIAAGTCGCGVVDEDNDLDGTIDCKDSCPTDPKKSVAGACGCGVADTDSDQDGTADCFDLCPNERTLISPIIGSCNPTQVFPDQCPLDPTKIAPGACGCGVPDTDLDQDGITDCREVEQIGVTAPIVRAIVSRTTARLSIQMSNASSGTYSVELTRLDRRGAKPIVKNVRSATATVTGLPLKSRWSVRYRIMSGRSAGAWSPAVQVRVR